MSSFAQRSLADVAQTFPQSIAVFEDAGVDFSCKGARSLADAARAAGYQPDELLSLIEASPRPTESVDWLRRPLNELTRHLAADHADLAARKLPALRELLESIAASHSSLKELRRVGALLSSFAASLTLHMAHEERDLFPRIEEHDPAAVAVSNGRLSQLVLRELIEHEVFREQLRMMRELCLRIRDDSAEDLRSEIEDLSRTVHYHMHLENNVLYPRAIESENARRHARSPERAQTMRTRSIPASELRSFLESFGRLHAGALVTMNVARPDIGAHDEIHDQPLRGISIEGDELIVHIAKNGSASHLAHRITHVTSVRLQQTEEGADAAVEIDAADGTSTVVRLRSPALPELLDPGVE